MKLRFERRPTAVHAGLLLAAALISSPLVASAQLVYDGNLLFNNNATGTLAGQFTGAATQAQAPSCIGGLDAVTIGTVLYTHNRYLDPLLPNALYQPNVTPIWQPLVGSPAYTQAMVVPADGFFTQTCYAGAIGPNPGDDWTQGWTTYDSTGATRQDLHLPGMPDPRPIAIYDNINLYSPQTWAPDSSYLIRGQLRIKEQSSLTIPAGDVVFEERASLGTIVVERGGQIFAVGTVNQPIIITTDDPPGTMFRGGCGGLVVDGRAKVNLVNSCAGDSAASEGGAIGFYGGNDDNDNSGTLKYVRIEFSGKEITPNNELNSFTFNGCGRGTHADYLEAFNGADDSFEWFGGAMDQKYLLGVDGTDDGYDWQMGTRNRTQFVIVRQSPRFAPSGTQNGDKGIEADDNEFDFNAVQCSGRSNPTIANMTMIGDKRVGPTFPGPSSGVNFRRGTAGTLINSICYGFKTAALRIDDAATFEAHCATPPTAPAVFCSDATTGVPLATGRVFVANAFPNPFRQGLAIHFALPRGANVSVSLYSADGRLVKHIANGPMVAGEHTIHWRADSSIPAGVYLYRVTADGASATGKALRVD